MMKILHIISSLEIGGAQRIITNLLPLINENSNEISLLVYEDIDNNFKRVLLSSGIKIYSLETKSIYNPIIIFKLIPILKQYDIVHVHLFPSLYWVAISSLFCRVKLMYTEHSTSNRRREKSYLKLFEKIIYSRYNKIVSISKQTQNELIKWLSLKDMNRFFVIENGIDLSIFYNEGIRKVDDKINIIMISRFVSSKDQHTLIKSLKYINNDLVHIIFVGDGEKLEECKVLTKELHLEHRISFLGSRSDISDLLSVSYIGVQSSNWEGFGLTAVEIMASGIPVIASNVPGLKEVVDGAGILFSKGDERDLASKIDMLLENINLYNELSNYCVERAKNYDIKLMAKKYLDLYNNLFSA